MFYGLSEDIAPNFEVLCFDEANTCVNKEYFHTYAEAREFEESEQTKLDYEWVSVTPMNARAHVEMYQAKKKIVNPARGAVPLYRLRPGHFNNSFEV